MTGRQKFSRWFTDWPSTHVNAGESVEVMPVSEHEAEMARRSHVDHQAAEALHREREALGDAARLVVDAEYRQSLWGPDTEVTFGRALAVLRDVTLAKATPNHRGMV